jgi:hypothetical protein
MTQERIFYQLESADGLKSEIKELDNFRPEIKTALFFKLGGSFTETIKVRGFDEGARTYKYEVPERVLFVTFKETK